MARTFNGSTYIDVADDAALNDTVFTCALWIKTTSTAVWEVVGKHNAANSRNGWGLYNAGGSPSRLVSYRKDSGTGLQTIQDASQNIADGNYHAVVARFDRTSGGPMDLMVDSVSVAQATPALVTTYTAGDPLRIGRTTDGFWSGFVGDVADFGLWNGRLTDDECLAFCKGETPGSIRPGALRLWLPMRD